MNGDIKIGKKTALTLITVLSLFTFANFVSVVDAESSGGVVIKSGLTKSDLEKIMPIGSVTFRMDDVNPSTIYGGEWSLIEGDATLTFGDGSNQTGEAVGDNEPNVPLVSHNHTKGTMNITGYFSIGGGSSTSSYNVYAATGAFYGSKAGSASYGHSGGTSLNQPNVVNFNAASSWTGETSKEGVDNAKLNVRGSRISINVWKRIN